MENLPVVSAVKDAVTGHVTALGDAVSGTQGVISKVTSGSTAVGLTFAVLMIVIVGFGLMVNKKTREWAKEHGMYVAIGIVVIVAASVFVSTMMNYAGVFG